MSKGAKNLATHPARMIKVDSSGNPVGAISEAGEVLSSGGLVAYPTESFYGLAADATNETAIKRLFLAKKGGQAALSLSLSRLLRYWMNMSTTSRRLPCS